MMCGLIARTCVMSSQMNFTLSSITGGVKALDANANIAPTSVIMTPSHEHVNGVILVRIHSDR